MPSNDVLTNSALKNRLIDSLKLLLIPGIGLKRYKVLVEELGSPGAVLGSSVARLGSLPRISENLAEAVHSSETAREATEIAARIIQLGWEVKFLGDDDYPQLLSKIADPPPLLFCVGSTAPTVELRIAIVGTRRASEQGRTFASNLARALVENGITVVSGMAEGIDSAAHTGALEAGGRTIAVWGSSLDIVYPSSNRTLAERIKGSGAVYSEYLPGTRPDTSTFPARNRIISGLSEGVVVVEAGVKSGALITASHALDQEREVFAVPGSPVSRSSQGT
ncbi:MAG: DNA-processing protein DprA, partial [Candidatus Zixiibacteriota bacterium]